MSSFDQLPVIDVEAIHSRDKSQQIKRAKEFYTAYSTADFSYITNHNVPDTLIEQVFEASQLVL